MAFIISADEIKKVLPGYNPENSDMFHEQSAKLADRAYAQALKERSEDKVILMSGGTASGKSEYISVYLMNEEAIILDGTLPTLKGAEIKIKKALKANKLVEIRCVLAQYFLVAFVAFLNRDRKFPNEHFYRTHHMSRKTALEIAQKYPSIPIKIIVSDAQYVGSKIPWDFRELHFDNSKKLIEFLEDKQYTEDEIKHMAYGNDIQDTL